VLALRWPEILSNAEAEILGKARVQRTFVGGAEGLGDRGDGMLSLRLRFIDCRGEGTDLAGRSSAVVSPASSTPKGVATSCFTCRLGMSLSIDNSSA
jgi:hypothetical protein